MREEIEEQRRKGRVTREVTRFSDGSEQVKITKTEGIDPALLRALSTHIDRRNRQAQNQMAPDVTTNQVNVAVVRDFLSQGETKGSLSAASWNETTIDASASDS